MRVPAVRWAVLGVVLTALFVALGLAVAGRPSALDIAVRNALDGDYRLPIGHVARIVSDILGPVLPVVFGVALLASGCLWWYRGDRDRAWLALRLTVVLVLCRVTSVVFKPVFSRGRPRAYAEFSYPSGHVVSVAGTGLVAVLLALWLYPRALRLLVPVVSVAIVLCAASRLVLGVHWLTDTVGGVLSVTGMGLLGSVALRVLPVRPAPPGTA